MFITCVSECIAVICIIELQSYPPMYCYHAYEGVCTGLYGQSGVVSGELHHNKDSYGILKRYAAKNISTKLILSIISSSENCETIVLIIPASVDNWSNLLLFVAAMDTEMNVLVKSSSPYILKHGNLLVIPIHLRERKAISLLYPLPR